jgi:hypothetical protein
VPVLEVLGPMVPPVEYKLFSNRSKDALEKMIWAEADKLGYLSIRLQTQSLQREQVVKMRKDRVTTTDLWK